MGKSFLQNAHSFYNHDHMDDNFELVPLVPREYCMHSLEDVSPWFCSKRGEEYKQIIRLDKVLTTLHG